MEKTKLSREMVSEYLTRYHEFVKEIAQYHIDVQGTQQPVAAIAQYGIEATMPKAQGGGHSDPTFNQATSHPTKDPYIMRRIAVVRAVKDFRKHVQGIRESDVLDFWLFGHTIIVTAEKLKVGKSTVQRCRDKIIDSILEGEQE